MRILAVDYGDARTGLAVCDPQELMASPAGVIQERRMERTVEQVAAAARELVGLVSWEKLPQKDIPLPENFGRE